MKKSVSLALAGAALLFPLFSLSVSGTAVAASDEIRTCVRHIAEIERNVARKTKGAERREIIAILGKAKIACMKGQIGSAYQGASVGLKMAGKARKS